MYDSPNPISPSLPDAAVEGVGPVQRHDRRVVAARAADGAVGELHPNRQARDGAEEQRPGDRGVDLPIGRVADVLPRPADERATRVRSAGERSSCDGLHGKGLQAVDLLRTDGTGDDGHAAEPQADALQPYPRDDPQAAERVPERGADHGPDRARLPATLQVAVNAGCSSMPRRSVIARSRSSPGSPKRMS